MSDQEKEQKKVKREQEITPDRKPAPNVSVVDEVYRDPRKAKLETAWNDLAREKGWSKDQLLAEKKRWHPYFSRGDVDPETMEAEGYIPFKVASSDNKERKQVRDRGDLLWMKLEEDAQKVIAAPGLLAKQMLSDTIKGNSSKYATEFDKNPD